MQLLTTNIQNKNRTKTLLQCNKKNCSYHSELKNLIFSVSFVSFLFSKKCIVILGTSPFKARNGTAVKIYIYCEKQRALLSH